MDLGIQSVTLSPALCSETLRHACRTEAGLLAFSLKFAAKSIVADVHFWRFIHLGLLPCEVTSA
jgi:hypothetical protein